MPPAAPGVFMTSPVTTILPPVAAVLIVSAPIYVTQFGARLVVPLRVILLAVIVEATLLKTPKPSVAAPLRTALPAVEAIATE